MSHNDKRKVSTDALETLGSLIDENEKRDAIHLAVIPVVAKEVLKPGQDVGPDGTADNPVGIVDPFLKERFISPGDRFWLVIYPRQITSLRHVWSHPAFDNEEEVNNFIKDKDEIREKADIWIAVYANSLGLRYEELMDAANEYIEHGTYVTGGYQMEGECTSDEFWEKYEIVKGIKLKSEDKGNFFSCSC